MPKIDPISDPISAPPLIEEETNEDLITRKTLEFKQKLISGLNDRCKKFIYKNGRITDICKNYENPRDMQFINFVNKMTLEELFEFGKHSLGHQGKPFDIATATGKIYKMIDADESYPSGGKKKSRRKSRKLNKKKSRRKKSHKRKRRTRRY